MTKVLIFDTETTGKDKAQIIEAAWLSLDTPRDLNVMDEFCQRYKPSKEIEFGAMATHHITMSDLDNKPPHTAFKLPECDYLIGHNVDYDWDMAGKPNVKRICTLAMARRAFPQVDSHSQSALIYFLDSNNAKERVRNAHSALADVYLCLTILNRCLLAFGRPQTWEEVYEISESCRMPKVMPFGKHKGIPFDEVPFDYLQWLIKQPDLDEYLFKAITKRLDNGTMGSVDKQLPVEGVAVELSHDGSSVSCYNASLRVNDDDEHIWRTESEDDIGSVRTYEEALSNYTHWRYV